MSVEKRVELLAFFERKPVDAPRISTGFEHAQLETIGGIIRVFG